MLVQRFDHRTMTFELCGYQTYGAILGLKKTQKISPNDGRLESFEFKS